MIVLWQRFCIYKVCICILLLESRSQSKSELQEYSLFEELTKYLYPSKKERIIVSESDNESQFQFIFSCFQNYEVRVCTYKYILMYMSSCISYATT